MLRLTVVDVAALTGKSVKTVRRAIDDGHLRAVRRGRELVITPRDARVWLGRELPPWSSKPSAFQFVSVDVYAAIAKLTPRQVRYLIEGGMEIVRVGGRVFVPRAEVERVLRMDIKDR